VRSAQAAGTDRQVGFRGSNGFSYDAFQLARPGGGSLSTAFNPHASMWRPYPFQTSLSWTGDHGSQARFWEPRQRGLDRGAYFLSTSKNVRPRTITPLLTSTRIATPHSFLRAFRLRTRLNKTLLHRDALYFPAEPIVYLELEQIEIRDCRGFKVHSYVGLRRGSDALLIRKERSLILLSARLDRMTIG